MRYRCLSFGLAYNTCCTVLYELKSLQSVHGESDTDAITGVARRAITIDCTKAFRAVAERQAPERVVQPVRRTGVHKSLGGPCISKFKIDMCNYACIFKIITLKLKGISMSLSPFTLK